MIGESVVGTFVGEEVGVDVVTAGQNAGLASFKSVCKSSKDRSAYKERITWSKILLNSKKEVFLAKDIFHLPM